ncbi:hypothetical protein CEXT_150181 [Caerostris extrusa]|uniref:Uncharacterized protein n=1 Tax=Caerostris extrusa TaxID=172846 RepID=A0AAV4XLI0_CAEEX|nr:hypothetical protein CEXT_150181 [Caerostris extrusa]
MDMTDKEYLTTGCDVTISSLPGVAPMMIIFSRVRDTFSTADGWDRFVRDVTEDQRHSNHSLHTLCNAHAEVTYIELMAIAHRIRGSITLFLRPLVPRGIMLMSCALIMSH